MNGIHNGGVSFNNLMYDISAETDNSVGIVNDFDLATWVDRPTTNNCRTGIAPFMAIDLLDGGLDRRIPRLYRHDLCLGTRHITIARVESPLQGVDPWFRDDDYSDLPLGIWRRTTSLWPLSRLR